MATRAEREAAQAEAAEDAERNRLAEEQAERERQQREQDAENERNRLAAETAEHDRLAKAEQDRIEAERQQADQRKANEIGQQDTRDAQAKANEAVKERGAAEASTNGGNPASAMKPNQQAQPGQTMDSDGTRHGVGNAGEGGTVAASDVGSPPALATTGSIADMAAHRYNDPTVGGSFAPVPADTTGDARTDLKPLTQPVQRLVPIEDHGEIPPVLATANLPAGSEPRHIDVNSGRDIVS